MPYLLANLLRALAGLLVTWWLGASDTAGRDHGCLRLPLGGAQLPGLAWPSPGPVGWLLTVPRERNPRLRFDAPWPAAPRGCRPVTHARV